MKKKILFAPQPKKSLRSLYGRKNEVKKLKKLLKTSDVITIIHGLKYMGYGNRNLFKHGL